MKNIALILCLLLAGLELHARGIRDDIDMVGDRARTSYAFGMMVGLDFSHAGLDLDYSAFMEGLMAAMEGDGESLIMDQQEALERVHVAFELAMERQAIRDALMEELFLAENAELPGVTETESGLQYVVIERGDGPRPTIYDTVLVHYEGVLLDGFVFDSSIERGFPEIIPVGLVIPGWAEAVQLMNVGSTYRFYIPSRLDYGELGMGQVIPPFATLVFTIHLIGIMEEGDYFPD